ncbi:MAG: zinc ABC transporter substrate-binding protein [Magnetococcales bacterium]|nr:zinc ABC transporter substrate-binding protein [Magnetococcales bacterium]MBF0117042.1 zinc ABC transporter substrate-binding protein [Magnetococcales bacterium]
MPINGGKRVRIRSIVLLVAGLLFGFVAPVQARVSVFACEPEWGALALLIGGDEVDIYVAATGKQDPHLIQARPSLIAQARRADLLFCTGAELEVGWLPVVMRQAANPNIQPGTLGYLEAAAAVQLREIPNRLDRADGDVHAAGNPHIQTDPRTFLPVAEQLTERLMRLDPSHAEYYQARYGQFVVQWQAALDRWQGQAAPLRGLPVAVHHNTWIYLFDWLGLRMVVTLEPKPGVPPSSGYLSEVLAKVKATPVRMTLRAAYEDERPAKWLEQHAGVPVIELPATVGGNQRAQDLFALFDDTVERLLKGAGAGDGAR